MNLNENVTYFVGKEIDNEFWCSFETDCLKKAQEFLQKQMQENIDKSWWCIYEKRTSFRMMESTIRNECKEEQLMKAMVAAM